MRHFLAIALLLAAGSLYALPQTFFAVDGGMNNNSREGMAVSGGVSLGWDLTSRFSMGVRAAFSHDIGTLFTVEEMALLRFYLTLNGLFLQAEGGGSLYFEEGWSLMSPLGGGCLGWRIGLGNTWYIELAGRGGYPFVWGGSLGLGLRF